MPLNTHKYTNGEITVIWKPDLCIHSGNCVKGLGEVFDPKRQAWIDVSKGSTAQIMEQVKKCPSGALSYILNEQENKL